VKVLKKSATVTYDVGFSLTKCIGFCIFTSLVPKFVQYTDCFG
jgi:hypothetical protein